MTPEPLKQSIWFDFVDGDHKSIIFTEETHPGLTPEIVLPARGEKVGMIETPVGAPTYILHTVIDVRHYIVQQDGRWAQEIHVMLSERP